MAKGEYARRLGVSPGSVSNWIKRGMPVGDDGLVDAATAEAWRAANIDQDRVRRGPVAEGQAAPSVVSLRARSEIPDLRADKLRAETAKLQRENDIAAGKLVDRGSIEQHLAGDVAALMGEALERNGVELQLRLAVIGDVVAGLDRLLAAVLPAQQQAAGQ